MYANEEQIELGVPSRQLSYQRRAPAASESFEPGAAANPFAHSSSSPLPGTKEAARTRWYHLRWAVEIQLCSQGARLQEGQKAGSARPLLTRRLGASGSWKR